MLTSWYIWTKNWNSKYTIFLTLPSDSFYVLWIPWYFHDFNPVSNSFPDFYGLNFIPLIVHNVINVLDMVQNDICDKF